MKQIVTSPNSHSEATYSRYGMLLVKLLFFFLIASAAQAELFIHQLKHQPAAQVIPIIQPHLAAETSITAKGFKLFVNGTKQDNQKVLNILKMIDTKLKEYLVEVKILNHQMNNDELNRIKISANAQSTRLQVKRHTIEANQSYGDNFVLRMIENYQAFVKTGESFPDNQVQSQYGHLLPSTGRTKISSGFYLTIQQTGDEIVAINISAQQQSRQSQDARSINSSSTSTRINGVIGKWTLIASNAGQRSNQTSKSYSAHSKASNKRWYYVRVNNALSE